MRCVDGGPAGNFDHPCSPPENEGRKKKKDCEWDQHKKVSFARGKDSRADVTVKIRRGHSEKTELGPSYEARRQERAPCELIQGRPQELKKKKRRLLPSQV